jgi:hypothetical protein
MLQWPAVVRPLDQIRMCVPGAILLFAVLLDEAAGRRALVRLVAGAAIVIGALHLAAIRDSLADRARCLRSPGWYPAALLGPLGRIVLPPDEERRLAGLVETIRLRCPPDGRVYAGAAYDLHALFLADRRGLRPYPTLFTAQSKPMRDAALAALREQKPAVALIQRRGVDLPFDEDRKEEWDWIRPRYRQLARFGDTEVWVPKAKPWLFPPQAE